MTTTVACNACLKRIDPDRNAGTCAECQLPIGALEARVRFPEHDIEVHLACGAVPTTYYIPARAGDNEATYHSEAEAEAAIASYVDEEDFDRADWIIKTRVMTPVDYYMLPEYEG